MLPKFPEEVAYLGGLIRKSRLVETEKGFYEVHIEHEQEFLEAVDALLKPKLGGKYKLENGNLVIHSPDVFDILVQSFGHPDADRRWALTQDITSGRIEHKAAFLRGLFDAFGVVDKTLVLKYSWHKDDLKGIKNLLEDLGVRSAIKKDGLHVKDIGSFLAHIGTLRPAHERRFVSILVG